VFLQYVKCVCVCVCVCVVCVCGMCVCVCVYFFKSFHVGLVHIPRQARGMISENCSFHFLHAPPRGPSWTVSLHGKSFTCLYAILVLSLKSKNIHLKTAIFYLLNVFIIIINYIIISIHCYCFI